MSVAKHHAEWLSLLDISGPFLSLNVLSRVFPQELETFESTRASELRAAYEEWLIEGRDPQFHRAWVVYILKNVLDWTDEVLAEGQAVPEPLKYTAIEHGGETIRPTFILHQRRQPNEAQALVMVYPLEQDLEKAIPRENWSASPAARMLQLLRTTGVRLGLVTNGEQWMLVNASLSGLAGYISWYAELWTEERVTLRAFTSLLREYRFFKVADEDMLAALLDKSANDAQEVTDQLGKQVREAVEILVRALDHANHETGDQLLDGINESDLYGAALTVMMRLVFLLSAEERGLFLLGDPLYDQNYAVSTLRAQLHEAADRLGEEVLERRYDAWSRLLATFRLVYHGSAHEDLKLPAYGGSLFDPDRFPFLEGGNTGAPPTINNRTVLHLLDALQILQTKGEARRLSFRALDIEQIGHVYEGLLDHEARVASEVMLGFTGGDEPEIALAELERQSNVAKYIKDMTGRGEKTIKTAMEKTPDPDRLRRLQKSCNGDMALVRRVMPYLNLLRDNEFDDPVVILPGSVYVTAGTERRATGTHYTPRSLTEPIVQHTLEPLVYRGVAEGAPRDEWQLKSPRELLALKVCDMAMGSGAFLVQACRYLAERLMDAWDGLIAEQNIPVPHLTIEGTEPTGALGELLIPDDPAERQMLALRLVADRCLYGVDKNPLAVEMGKLSIWLTTLAKGRPFTFLDHALKQGDSLLGVSVEQLRLWNLDLKAGDIPLYRHRLKEQVTAAVEKRLELESFTVLTVEDQRRKENLLREAEIHLHTLRTNANLLIASYLVEGLKDKARDDLRLRLLDAVMTGRDLSDGDQMMLAPVLRRYTPFHWELEFPEVFGEGRGGFDAFVGNPPFMGGSKITGGIGTSYRGYLVSAIAHEQSGNADLCAYFFLRAYDKLNNGGGFGLIATNTIAQGDTRDVGLWQLDQLGATIYRAENDHSWEGAAAVVVDIIHIYKGNYHNQRFLDNQSVDFITPLLDDVAVNKVYLPYRLQSNANKSFGGTYVLGTGFALKPEEAQALIEKNIRNRDVLFPYLGGEDLNDNFDQKPTRWIVNFFNWDETRAKSYPDCYDLIKARVYSERQKNSDEKLRRLWWIYKRSSPSLYSAIEGLDKVLVRTQVSNTWAFCFVPQSMVYDQRLIVFAHNSFSLMQSSIHYAWALRYASTLKTDMSYTPSDVFETFPFPADSALSSLESIGEQYHETRRQIMLDRQEGLTATYNRFHNPAETSRDIQGLRDLHRQMDEAVAAAYGWSDLALGHDFHETDQGTRYTISEAARREVLRRLLALNFERHAAEVATNEVEAALAKAEKAASKGKGKKGIVSETPKMFGE